MYIYIKKETYNNYDYLTKILFGGGDCLRNVYCVDSM